MANLQVYTGATAYIDSKLLAEEASIKITWKSGASPVFTYPKGFAGMSPGAPMIEVTIESAVPSVDFELNPSLYIQDLKVVELTIAAAGRTLSTKGFMPEGTFSHAVNQEGKIDITLMCQPAKFE